MSCNCKTVRNGEDIDEGVVTYMDSKKLTFFTKLVVVYNFLEFYFYFVTTSIINFMATDKLEPSIPKRLLKKYNKNG